MDQQPTLRPLQPLGSILELVSLTPSYGASLIDLNASTSLLFHWSCSGREFADIWADSEAPLTRQLSGQVQGMFEPIQVRDDLLQSHRGQQDYMALTNSLVYIFGAVVSFLVGVVGLTIPSNATQTLVLSIITLSSGVLTGLTNKANEMANTKRDAAGHELNHLYSIFPELDESQPNRENRAGTKKPPTHPFSTN